MSDAFRSTHPDWPWTEMRSMRNHQTHGYANVDVQIVWATAANDLPRLANLAAAPAIANKPVAPRRPEGITAT